MFQLKLCAEMGGAEADPVTEMLVLENLAYNDLTSGWCTKVGATAIASLGTFLSPSGLDRVFGSATIPTASISFFPAGRARSDSDGYRVSGRWRFNSGIRHAEWVVGGTVIEDAEPGQPQVMFSAFPAKDVTLYDNWGGVTGLRGTGSCDCSVENYRQIKQIAASIQEFGFINPVLVDGSDGLVAGHARVTAAISLGMTDVPTVRVDSAAGWFCCAAGAQTGS